ncbi:tRNA lysidine(34) synthetase TilS [Catenovulum agarivorans]|uniref:tRNA lysidine(34) synthetase TilS n=1 Tax=Catenovulum agarivorans TaxID=1172192 RepID=UPI0002ED3CA0|nr:tRNA lysidine(34) synthetase TilS [Catenovulum agarivorans]
MFIPEQIIELDKYHQQGYQFVVAFSGGVDSTVLLYLVQQHSQALNIPVTAIYVNHGLSANADNWQQHCQQVAEQIGVQFKAVKVNIQQTNRQSIEQLAREARYQALIQHSADKSVIFAGQHQDDQTETFLLRLKRGSGPNGLACMRPLRNLTENRLLYRPLLHVTRAEIESFANQHSLRWIEDESNQNQVFERNFLRKQIIPQLSEKWPQFSAMVSRSAQLCSEYQLLADELAFIDAKAAIDPNNRLLVEACLSLSQQRQNNLIRYWLQSQRVLLPSSKQMQQIEQVLLAKDDAQPIVQLACSQIRRFNKKLYLLKQAELDWIAQTPSDILVELKPQLRLLAADAKSLTIKQVKQGRRIRLATEQEQVSIRYNIKSSTKCLPDYRHQSRTIKKILQELSIEPWFRHKVAYLYYNDSCVAALGYWIDKNYLIEDSSDKPQIGWTWVYD